MAEPKIDQINSDRWWGRGLTIYCFALLLILAYLFFVEYYVTVEAGIELTEYESVSEAAGIYLVGINSATDTRLQSLPGIGPVLSQAIITYRNEHGPFQSAEQLLEVPGIGEKTLQQLLPLISLD